MDARAQTAILCACLLVVIGLAAAALWRRRAALWGPVQGAPLRGGALLVPTASCAMRVMDECDRRFSGPDNTHCARGARAAHLGQYPEPKQSWGWARTMWQCPATVMHHMPSAETRQNQATVTDSARFSSGVARSSQLGWLGLRMRTPRAWSAPSVA